MNKQRNLRIITTSAIIFIVLLLVALVVNIVRLSSINSKKDDLRQRLNAINAQIESNEREIDWITTDEYIDQYAREYLNMTGKDDQAFTGK